MQTFCNAALSYLRACIELGRSSVESDFQHCAGCLDMPCLLGCCKWEIEVLWSCTAASTFKFPKNASALTGRAADDIDLLHGNVGHCLDVSLAL